jgi:hypothetical protein
MRPTAEELEAVSLHTPLPWKARGHFIGTDDCDPQTIAYVDDHRNRRPRSVAETNANAALIALAPTLLARCQSENLRVINEVEAERRRIREMLLTLADVEESSADWSGATLLRSVANALKP